PATSIVPAPTDATSEFSRKIVVARSTIEGAAASASASGNVAAAARLAGATMRTMLPHFGHACTSPRNRSSRTLSRAWHVSQRRKNGSTKWFLDRQADLFQAGPVGFQGPWAELDLGSSIIPRGYFSARMPGGATSAGFPEYRRQRLATLGGPG